MKVHIENLGILKQAEFELGGLTIICGKNNTGKTYAAYALFGFLLNRDEHLNITVPPSQVKDLMDRSVVNIDLKLYADKARRLLADACVRYTKTLPHIFASRDAYFRNSKFSVTLSPEEINCYVSEEVQHEMKAGEDHVFSLSKKKGESILEVSFLPRTVDACQLHESSAKYVISAGIRRLLFESCLPRPHIAGPERTGAAIFRKHLDSSQSHLLSRLSKEKDHNSISSLLESYQGYTLPEQSNIDFTRELDHVSKRDSFLAREHAEALNDLTDIVGGEYIVGKHDIIYFKPSNATRVFTMAESSGTARSLLDIDFYLRHLVEKGNILMIDEPELSLHPENQRKMARLLARLTNVGVKVFITTHSDYIIKELSTLTSLSERTPRLKRIACEEGYHDEEIIHPEKIRAYAAEKALVKPRGKKRRSKIDTLVEANVSQESGIELDCFNEAIEEMNRIQDAIIWEED